MEKYKAKIRMRMIWMSMALSISAIAYFVLLLNQNQLPKVPDFIKGFQIGAFCGLELVLVYFVARDLGSMRNEKALRKLYIEEHDERAILIMQKTGAWGMVVCSVGLAFATVIAGFYNQMVFLSLLGATVFTALVKGFFKLYYHHKLSGRELVNEK